MGNNLIISQSMNEIEGGYSFIFEGHDSDTSQDFKALVIYQNGEAFIKTVEIKNPPISDMSIQLLINATKTTGKAYDEKKRLK